MVKIKKKYKRLIVKKMMMPLMKKECQIIEEKRKITRGGRTPERC
jgi:hypothetical protein